MLFNLTAAVLDVVRLCTPQFPNAGTLVLVTQMYVLQPDLTEDANTDRAIIGAHFILDSQSAVDVRCNNG